jgi:hypothetical protein
VLSYALPGAFPRAWVVPYAAAVSPLDDVATAHMLIDDRFDPARVALVSGAAPKLPAGASSGSVSIVDTSDQSLTMTASTPGLVVLSDTWYPRWRATVDGKPVDVLRVNDCMRGIVAPRAGAVIRLWYDDDHLPWWIALSLIVSLAAAISAVNFRLRRVPPKV